MIFSGCSTSQGVSFSEVSIPGGKLELLCDGADGLRSKLCCQSFEVLGRGRYRGLFDPVLQKIPQDSRISMINPLLHEFLNAAEYPAIFVGESFFSFRVPGMYSSSESFSSDCDVLVTESELLALTSAIRNLLQDGPSASTNQAPPVVMPPVYDDDTAAEGGTSSHRVVFVDPSDQTMFRFFNVDLAFDGLSLTFCEDYRSSVIPLLRSSVSIPQMAFRYSPASFLVSAERVDLRMDYLNTVTGDWEPCVERLQSRVAWRSAVPLQRVLSHQRKMLATQRLRILEQKCTVDPTVKDIETFDWMGSANPNNLRLKSRQRPIGSFKFISTLPIYLNITPRLVQLGLLLIPLWQKSRPATLAPKRSSLSVHNHMSQEIMTSAFNCINISGCDFTLARIEETSGQTPSEWPASLLKLKASTTPISLDEFMNQTYRGDRQSAAGIMPTYYLIPEPNNETTIRLTKQIRESIPEGWIVEVDSVRRCLVALRDENKTVGQFNKEVEIQSKLPHPTTVLDPAQVCIGYEIPRNAHIHLIDMKKSTAVVLPSPFSSNRSQDPDNRYTFAEIISPHPSIQLLLLSTVAKVFNHSGLPMQISFLDPHNSPIRIQGPLYVWTAPSELFSARLARIAITGKSSYGQEFGLNSLFDSALDKNNLEHPCVTDWNLDPTGLPTKCGPLPVTTRYTRPESGFPAHQNLNQVLHEVFTTAEYSYSMLLIPDHFLSVPQCAFDTKNHSVRVSESIFRNLLPSGGFQTGSFP